jgi:glycosyltransferase involved in cell wall biosynthesis
MSFKSSVEAFRQRWQRRLRGPITRERVVGYLRRKWRHAIHGLSASASQRPSAPSVGQALTVPDGVTEYSLDYPRWIEQRVERRRAEYVASHDESLFSIITPVFNTPRQFLIELARSIFAQDFPFEWVLADDCSTKPETLAMLDELQKDARVRFVRLPSNGGIMRATRAAFDAARGRYVLPVDHDDVLYPDALRVMAAGLEKTGWPAITYSDEDKIHTDSIPCQPFFKPDWDPALFMNCCYIAHLCAIDRRVGEQVGLYTDNQAHGCHDWDSVTRLVRHGHLPVHIPEVLYSWRIHPGSTASFHDRAKMYTLDCQKHVLEKHLAAVTTPNRFEVRTNPLFRHIGMWYPARRHVEPKPLHLFVVSEDSPRQLAGCLKSVVGDTPYPDLSITVLGLLTEEHREVVSAVEKRLRDDRVHAVSCPRGFVEFFRDTLPSLSPDTLVGILSDNLQLNSNGWAWEAVGVFDLHADAVAVAPRLQFADGLVASAGEHFGFNGIAGSPDQNRHPATDCGYHGWAFCQRTVSLVPDEFHIGRRDFLLAAVRSLPETASRGLWGAWLGATAARSAGRVVYSPFVQATYVPNRQPAAQPSPNEEFDFVSRHHDLLIRDQNYSRFFELRPGQGFTLATPRERASVLNFCLSRLQGPFDFVGQIEVSPWEYSPAEVRRPAAGRRFPNGDVTDPDRVQRAA